MGVFSRFLPPSVEQQTEQMLRLKKAIEKDVRDRVTAGSSHSGDQFSFDGGMSALGQRPKIRSRPQQVGFTPPSGRAQR
jgi:hypothetical protein